MRNFSLLGMTKAVPQGWRIRCGISRWYCCMILHLGTVHNLTMLSKTATPEAKAATLQVCRRRLCAVSIDQVSAFRRPSLASQLPTPHPVGQDVSHAAGTLGVNEVWLSATEYAELDKTEWDPIVTPLPVLWLNEVRATSCQPVPPAQNLSPPARPDP